jgi:Na+/H+ antiporter NhaD/arsenite permease-like protein
MKRIGLFILVAMVLLLAAPSTGLALGEAVVTGSHPSPIDAVSSWLGLVCLGIFVLAYLVVMTEGVHKINKSMPVILAAGAIWGIIALRASELGVSRESIHEAVLSELSDFSTLFMFLLVAMTYVNAMNDRNVFAAIRSWIVQRRWSYRRLLWVTGTFAFFLSAVVDNLISALLMGAVIIAVGKSSRRFVSLACAVVVVAANAGGAFSPFGDITTLMVWQSGQLSFFQFFELFLPSVAAFLVPAAIMSMFAPHGSPEAVDDDVRLKTGSRSICLLFALTITLAVVFEHYLELPPFLGMMTGMSLLMIFTHATGLSTGSYGHDKLDVYKQVGKSEWDTLLFFFGVIFAIGGLGFIGYLEFASTELYGRLGPSAANIIAGAFSAVIDNIPVMFSILKMNPPMDNSQWLLITYCAGVGGSLLSIGSAAGVGMMGVARGQYTFANHLKWTPVIALGYAAGIVVHFLVSGI